MLLQQLCYCRRFVGFLAFLLTFGLVFLALDRHLDGAMIRAWDISETSEPINANTAVKSKPFIEEAFESRDENLQEILNAGFPVRGRNHASKLQAGLVNGHNFVDLLAIPTSLRKSTR